MNSTWLATVIPSFALAGYLPLSVLASQAGVEKRREHRAAAASATRSSAGHDGDSDVVDAMRQVGCDLRAAVPFLVSSRGRAGYLAVLRIGTVACSRSR